MAVVATAGTTATGSFDDLEAIGSLCAERGIWLHVDAAHGASALLSARPPRALKGLSHSRSLAWDPHKMMLLPLATGMVLTRDEGDLERAFAQQFGASDGVAFDPVPGYAFSSNGDGTLTVPKYGTKIHIADIIFTDLPMEADG